VGDTSEILLWSYKGRKINLFNRKFIFMKKGRKLINGAVIHFAIICLAIFITPQAKAQGNAVSSGASVVKGLYTAAEWTHRNWNYLSWISQGVIKGFHFEHRWWACIYQDGFITYNNFRSYRTSMDAYNYFIKGRGDCDAVYGSSNSRICYENPMQAEYYTKQHGRIVDIKYQDYSGRYHSIFEY
jgi:hypothetical protein